MHELAVRFSEHLARHIRTAPKQSTRTGPVEYFELCRRFNEGEATADELVEYTERHAFDDVIDRFHVVGREDVPIRFYIDERSSSGGITLTKDIHELADSLSGDLNREVESRWNLVETAWTLNLPARLIEVQADTELNNLTIMLNGRRSSVTSARGALNGYQRGSCFYCFRPISIVPGNELLGQVDHFFPFVLGTRDRSFSGKVDGVWNLVLSCASCNGPAGKSDKVPSPNLLQRLDRRNEYLIESNHPLKETIKKQTGQTMPDRHAFLQAFHTAATSALIHNWEPTRKGAAPL